MTERTLTFTAAEVDPPEGSIFDTYLLYNQCDGYHIAYANFDDGVFDCFRNFIGTCRYEKSFYAAWAKLPDSLALFPIFGRSPSPATPEPTYEERKHMLIQSYLAEERALK